MKSMVKKLHSRNIIIHIPTAIQNNMNPNIRFIIDAPNTFLYLYVSYAKDSKKYFLG